jgi:hypothetical protein
MVRLDMSRCPLTLERASPVGKQGFSDTNLKNERNPANILGGQFYCFRRGEEVYIDLKSQIVSGTNIIPSKGNHPPHM